MANVVRSRVPTMGHDWNSFAMKQIVMTRCSEEEQFINFASRFVNRKIIPNKKIFCDERSTAVYTPVDVVDNNVLFLQN